MNGGDEEDAVLKGLQPYTENFSWCRQGLEIHSLSSLAATVLD